MATFVKTDKFVLNLGKKVFNLSTDQLKIALTNTLPVASTANQYSDLTSPLPTTNLTGATPFNLTTTSYLQTSGVAKLIIDDLTLVATGVVAPFRYVVLYSDTAANDEIIGFYDVGIEINLVDTSTFIIDFSASNGVLTIT